MAAAVERMAKRLEQVDSPGLQIALERDRFDNPLHLEVLFNFEMDLSVVAMHLLPAMILDCAQEAALACQGAIEAAPKARKKAAKA
jgi:hypothetical protein